MLPSGCLVYDVPALEGVKRHQLELAGHVISAGPTKASTSVPLHVSPQTADVSAQDLSAYVTVPVVASTAQSKMHDPSTEHPLAAWVHLVVLVTVRFVQVMVVGDTKVVSAEAVTHREANATARAARRERLFNIRCM
jgi:hypothetical protein